MEINKKQRIAYYVSKKLKPKIILEKMKEEGYDVKIDNIYDYNEFLKKTLNRGKKIERAKTTPELIESIRIMFEEEDLSTRDICIKLRIPLWQLNSIIIKKKFRKIE